MNTWDRWYGNGSAINTAVDYRMYYPSTGSGTCATIKNSGLTIYTIQVNTGGDPTSTLLQNCAGSPDKLIDSSEVFMVTTASGLGTVFNSIGTSLTKLRVASNGERLSIKTTKSPARLPGFTFSRSRQRYTTNTNATKALLGPSP
ncbi:MAG: hypothetical protein WDN48_13555 [Pseudolabrys sp.]